MSSYPNGLAGFPSFFYQRQQCSSAFFLSILKKVASSSFGDGHIRSALLWLQWFSEDSFITRDRKSASPTFPLLFLYSPTTTQAHFGYKRKVFLLKKRGR
jgi:hypothetical protein